jgi:hypothetical protein
MLRGSAAADGPLSSIGSFTLTPPAIKQRVSRNHSNVLSLFHLGRDY